MYVAIAPVAALLLSVAILLMGNGLQGTLLPVRAHLEEFSTLDIGILGSAYFLSFAGGCVLGPYVIRRVGHIRAFTAMSSAASAVALAHALILSPAVWWPLRAITGFCFAVLYTVIESWLNERSSNENRGLVLSIYTIINLTVLTIGQMMITLYDPAAFPLFSIASILVSLAALPVALTASPAPAPLETVRLRIGHLYRLSPVGFTGCLAVGLVNGSFWSLAPFFAQNSGMDIPGVALFMSVTVIAGALGQWPLGHASDRMDRRKVIIFACIAAAAAGIGMDVFNDIWDRGILAFAFLFGLFAFPIYALCVAHTNDFVEPDGFVEASSGLLLVYGAGAVVGPLLAAGLMETLGPDGLFAFTAFFHASMAAFALYRMRQRARPPEQLRSDFVTVPQTAPSVSNLDPRAMSASEVPVAGPRPAPGAGEPPAS